MSLSLSTEEPSSQSNPNEDLAQSKEASTELTLETMQVDEEKRESLEATPGTNSEMVDAQPQKQTALESKAQVLTLEPIVTADDNNKSEAEAKSENENSAEELELEDTPDTKIRGSESQESPSEINNTASSGLTLELESVEQTTSAPGEQAEASEVNDKQDASKDQDPPQAAQS